MSLEILARDPTAGSCPRYCGEVDAGFFRAATNGGRGHDAGLVAAVAGRAASCRAVGNAVAGMAASHIEGDERGADRDHVPGLAGEPQDLARDRRGQLDRGLVGHHCADDGFLGDLVTDLDEPFADLGLDHTFAEVRKLEVEFAHPSSMILRMPLATRFLPGKYCHSNACG